ncbi:hypothetical protein BDB00DRAFT_795804 [Zychaea mexicana]|uniref:uncharacterized protein n=1 Tax=Zychaea mexicana TaxID=64656 RepID=UPI0022FED8F7|nr:uncharacterized protein BDB00DRAFT_795804 [Zychaea mexicana]KAI9499199.1 hypothetical protein BDB00DRAFT_795804 [Zychaea mexicana]
MADNESRPPRRRYLAGICALIAVVFIWVSSSFAMNSIFGEQNYDKPFLVTYLNTATFSFYLLPLLFARRRKNVFSPEELIMREDPTTSYRTTNNNNNEPNRPSLDLENEMRTVVIEGGEGHGSNSERLNTIETIRLSLAFCILWFCANYTTNASLAYTSVGSSTILSSTSGLFTLAIGALFRVERLTLIRIAAVAVSFGGVVLVSYSDQESANKKPQEPNAEMVEASAPLIGDFLALTGALFYGCYTTLLKYRIRDESRINMPLFFGFVGSFNVLLLWPIFPILHWLGLETFELPHGGVLGATLLLNAFIGTFLSDYLWLLAMLMTSPLVVTLGISLTIPLALVGDLIFKHIVPGIQYAAGAILVLIGFFAVNVATLSEVENKAIYAEREIIPQEEVNDMERALNDER